MTPHEQKIYDLVHTWCNQQHHDIPDQNRRHLMDLILELTTKDAKKPGKTPTIEEFMAHAKTLSPYTPEYDFSIIAKYNQWVDAGWKDGYNKPIKNWKSKLMNVFPHLKKIAITNNEQPNKFTHARDIRDEVANELLKRQ